MDGQREASIAINGRTKGGKQRHKWTGKGGKTASKMDGQREASSAKNGRANGGKKNRNCERADG